MMVSMHGLPSDQVRPCTYIEGSKEDKEYYRNHHTCFTVLSVDAFAEVLTKNNIVLEDRDGVKMAISSRVDGVKQLGYGTLMGIGSK